MGTFDLGKNNDAPESEQLTFDQLENLSFQAGQLDFAEPTNNLATRKSNANYSYALIDQEKESKTSRFIGLSALFHLGLAVLASLATIPLIEKTKVETISIELTNSQPAEVKQATQQPQIEAKNQSPQMAKPAQEVPTQIEKTTPAVAQIKNEKQKAVTAAPKAALLPPTKISHMQKPIAKHSLKAKQAQTKQKAATKSTAIIAAPRTAPKSAEHTTKSSIKPVVKESAVAVPQTIDDIQAQELDETAVKNSTPGEIDENDFSNEIQKVNQKQNKLLALEQAKLDQQAAEVEKETEQSVAAVAQENNREKARIAALNEARRNKEAAAIAAASAAEKQEAAETAAAASAAAKQASEARAAKIAALNSARAQQAKESLEATKAAALAANGARNSHGAGSETEGSGGSSQSGTVAGIPESSIRQLEDLRQLPGNPQPSYDQVERLKGHHGKAIFLAYISKEGRTSQFRLVQPTGYRNLDAKTLAALKQWKFYPGQEGWVELPVEWNLKGGPQEQPTLLRRSSN